MGIEPEDLRFAFIMFVGLITWKISNKNRSFNPPQLHCAHLGNFFTGNFGGLERQTCATRSESNTPHLQRGKLPHPTIELGFNALRAFDHPRIERLSQSCFHRLAASLRANG